MRNLILEIEKELTKTNQSGCFSNAVEYRYQRDINATRRRHLIVCLVLGVLTYNSFLIWKFFLLGDDFFQAAIQMAGISIPCTVVASVLMCKLPIPLRESVALLPAYADLAVVYNIIIDGLHTHASTETLFIFCLPLMFIYVNTCMKSPFKIALTYNLYALILISSAIYQAPITASMAGLMLTAAGASAFFTLLGNYWSNMESRWSYLYRVREELRAASLSTANHDLQRLSETDALTGLANRRQMQPYLDQLWSSHLRGETEGAVLLIDIDHFKLYNDYYGHLTGDECLRSVATALKKNLRPNDAIARFGGEEFVVLLVDIEPDAARDTAVKLLQSVRKLGIAHLGRNDGASIVTVSIGLAHSTKAGLADGAALLDQADRALYQAKRSGRDCFKDIGSAFTLTDTTLPSPADLRRALSDNQLELYFQPLYQLTPYKLTGYECLLRWQHPRLGTISPDYFIGLAERSGLIVALGNWVLEQSCTKACEWSEELSLSVNISPLQLNGADIVEGLASILAHTGLSGRRLILELTEGAKLDIDEQVQTTLTQLSALGVRLALDDFGCGHANLDYLLQLPFKILKIDRQALRIEHPTQRRQVLGALLALGRAFALEILAEGVETSDDLALLRELGFDHAQGYLLGRPQPMISCVASLSVG